MLPPPAAIVTRIARKDKGGIFFRVPVDADDPDRRPERHRLLAVRQKPPIFTPGKELNFDNPPPR
jgi:hypothetical protein